MSGFDDISDAVVGLTSSVFGTPVGYTPVGGSLVTINGVFTNAYVDVQGISALRPVLRIRLSDLAAAPAKGDTAQINSVNYSVASTHPDGHGGSTLVLQKA